MQQARPSVEMREQILLTQHHTFLEQHDRAIEIAENLLTKPDPNGHPAMVNLGVALMASGREEAGLRILVDALELCVQHWGTRGFESILGKIGLGSWYRKLDDLKAANVQADSTLEDLNKLFANHEFYRAEKGDLLRLRCRAFRTLAENRWQQNDYADHLEYARRSVADHCRWFRWFPDGMYRLARGYFAVRNTTMAARTIRVVLRERDFAQGPYRRRPDTCPSARQVAEAQAALVETRPIPDATTTLLSKWRRYHSSTEHVFETDALQLAGDIHAARNQLPEAREYYKSCLLYTSPSPRD